MEPALNSRMVAVNTHVVSPLRDPKASEETMKAFTDFTGNDARAYFLQQQYCKTSGYGLLKYADWGKLFPDLNAKFNDYLGDKTSAQAYADEATRLIDLALGAQEVTRGGAGRAAGMAGSGTRARVGAGVLGLPRGLRALDAAAAGGGAAAPGLSAAAGRPGMLPTRWETPTRPTKRPRRRRRLRDAARSVGVDPARRRLRCSELRLQPTLWGGAGAGGAPAAPPGLPPRGGAPSTGRRLRPDGASRRRSATRLGRRRMRTSR